MYEDTKNPPRKVVDEHISKVTGIPKFGYCPWCTAAMSYRDEIISRCLCCKKLVEWSPIKIKKP